MKRGDEEGADQQGSYDVQAFAPIGARSDRWTGNGAPESSQLGIQGHTVIFSLPTSSSRESAE